MIGYIVMLILLKVEKKSLDSSHVDCIILGTDSIKIDKNPIPTISNKLNCINISSDDGFEYILFIIYTPNIV